MPDEGPGARLVLPHLRRAVRVIPADRWLWVGLAGGLALVLWGLVRPAPSTLGVPDDRVAAIVGDVTIAADRYHRAVALLAVRTKGPPPGTALRRRVLDDLIAEELLLARALELDLPRVAALSRRRLLVDVIDTIGSDIPAPTEADLAAWYAANPQQFGRRDAYRVDALFFRGADAQARATVAAVALRAGAALETVRLDADRPLAPAPRGLVQAPTLRTYLGPTATRDATGLEIGAVTDPVAGAGGFQVVRLVEVATVDRPALDAVRDAVRTLVVQERRRARVDAVVAELRAATEVVINDALLEADTPIPERWLRAARTEAR